MTGGAPSGPTKCQKGEKRVPSRAPGVPRWVANGCGPQGMRVEEPFGLYRCCNGHDVCFATCGTTHKFCEDDFRRCMAATCARQPGPKQKQCEDQANSFAGMTGLFGKGFHESSQAESCQCAPKDKAESRWKEYAGKLYTQMTGSEDTGAVVAATMNRHGKGKQGMAVYELVRRYGAKKLVQFDGIPAEFEDLGTHDAIEDTERVEL
eukprot:TRINITY_DN18882_c0_g1_i1.p1 TRINITY_DN18882_c0_g1~~TRINITY_DN18882_c0_g1_i1.p1  ORF type:complete len:207 (+),score=36.66 TRINITY_DN18882_c0_g1_i1:226-846(+)